MNKWIENISKLIFHVNVNVNLIEENVNQINDGITINATVGLKNIYSKKIVFAIQLNAILKMENAQ